MGTLVTNCSEILSKIYTFAFKKMHLKMSSAKWRQYIFGLNVLILFSHTTLRWRHNDQDGVSNHQPHGCLLNRLFRRRSNKTSKLRVTGLCVGNSPGPVNSPHKGPVTRKMFPFDDVIMSTPWFSIHSKPSCCSIGYSPETRARLKSYKTSFAYNCFLNAQLFLKLWQYHYPDMCKFADRFAKWNQCCKGTRCLILIL